MMFTDYTLHRASVETAQINFSQVKIVTLTIKLLFNLQSLWLAIVCIVFFCNVVPKRKVLYIILYIVFIWSFIGTHCTLSDNKLISYYTPKEVSELIWIILLQYELLHSYCTTESVYNLLRHFELGRFSHYLDSTPGYIYNHHTLLWKPEVFL